MPCAAGVVRSCDAGVSSGGPPLGPSIGLAQGGGALSSGSSDDAFEQVPVLATPAPVAPVPATSSLVPVPSAGQPNGGTSGGRRPAPPAEHAYNTRASRRRKEAATQEREKLALNESERCYEVHAPDLEQLGHALAKAYRGRFLEGLRRSREYYLTMKPISCSEDTWNQLADHARAAAELHCPAARVVFDAVSRELGSSAYAGLLDFEVYTLELQRQARDRRLSHLKRASATAEARMKLQKAQERGDLKGIVSAETVLNSARRASSSSSCCSSSSTTSSDSSCTLDPQCDNMHNRSSSKGGSSNDKEGQLEESGSNKSTHSSSVGPKPANALGEVGKPLSGRCTGFALVGTEIDSDAVVAQSVDLPPLLYGFGDYDCVLRLSTSTGGVLAYDTDGRLCPIGLNSAGLGVTVFNLFQPYTCGFQCPALSTQLVAWELLLGQYTVESAIAWLQALPSPGVMCGGALLLADASGAVMVELSPGAAPGISIVTKGSPLVRANHVLLLQSDTASTGESRKAVRDSMKRQEALVGTLKALEAECGQLDEQQQQREQQQHHRHQQQHAVSLESKQISAVDGKAALRLLAISKGVRNVSTLACIVCDLKRRELRVEFRERLHATDDETLEAASILKVPLERATRLLMAGAVRRDSPKARLQTGEGCRHFTRWKAHVYSLRNS